MTPRSVLAPALLSLALLAAGCSADESDGPTTCTLVGCGAPLSLQLSTDDGTWSIGNYELTVTADGQASTCTLSLPQPLTDQDPGEGWTCSGGLMAFLRRDTSCDGGACGPGRFLLDVSLDAAPAQVRAVLHHERQIVLDQGLSPTYQESTPNGPGCAPVCQHATATLVISGAAGER